MQTVALTYEQAFELAAVAAAVGGAGALVRSRQVRAVAAFLREAAMIGVLYGLWQYAGQLSLGGIDQAMNRARAIQRWEHWLPLPSERAMQAPVMHVPPLVQFANLYYATMHFTVLFVFLTWLFVRHRDRYRPVRRVLAVTTLFCLLVQLIPVAPPRLLPGIHDTALMYGQSVYGGFAFDQYGAMPSVHVAWAVFVGWYAWRVSPSRWRWLGPAHSVVTILVVVVTGNHWWTDGIVAVALLVASAWLVAGVQAALAALAARLRPVWHRATGSPSAPLGTATDDAPPPVPTPEPAA